MKKRIIVIIFQLSTMLRYGHAQSTNYQLPDITPVSPAAQNFMRYGEIPVDYSTGVPNISVPLYKLKSRKLELPITMSYHASGIKVNDRASTIGLGWVLNASGFITSTINDGQFGGSASLTYKTAQDWINARQVANDANNVTTLLDFGSLLETNKSYAWLSDRFYFQLPNGESGNFRTDISTGQLIQVPYSPLKIDDIVTLAQSFPYTNVLSGFTITDETGTIYTFNLSPGGTTRSWDLTKIASADKTDSIRFVYKTGQYATNVYWSYLHSTVLDYGQSAVPYSLDPGFAYDFNVNNFSSNNTTFELLLDSIVSVSTIIKIGSVADRQDMGTLPYNGGYRIEKLSVYDGLSNTLVKEYSFNQSYFGTQQSDNLRLRLDGVSVAGSDLNSVENYNFVYESLELPSYTPYTTGSAGPFAEDFWGYYNGIPTNYLLPSQFVPASPTGSNGQPTIPGLYSTDRSASPNYAKACMIKEIHYPTAGKTVFDFEPNYADFEYQYGTVKGGYVGGFRVRTISNYTSDNVLATYKTYTYGPGSTRPITADLFTYQQREVSEVPSELEPLPNGDPPLCETFTTAVDRTIVTSSPLLPLSAENGPPIFYGRVIEYNGDSTGIVGKTVYSYLPPIPYPDHTEGIMDEPRFGSSLDLDRGNYLPKIVHITNYKNVNGQFIPVDSTVNSYSSFLSDEYNTGIHMVQTTSYNPTSDWQNDYSFPDYATCKISFFTTLNHPNYFYFVQNNATQEVVLPTETTKYLFSSDGMQSMATTTDYTYGSLLGYTYGASAHVQPTEKTMVNSRGETLKTVWKYPTDFSPQPPYDAMVARNILNPVIEQDQYNNSEPLQFIKTNYKTWIAPNIIEPDSVQTTEGGITEVRLRYHDYDNFAHVKSVSKENDFMYSYLYDYNQSRPIAQVMNATVNDIAYTSFEADGKGNWAFTGVPITPTSGTWVPTGMKYYALAAGSISKTGLSATTSYTLSFWYQSGSSVMVTGGTQSNSVTITGKNGWILSTRTITGTTSLTISGTGDLDELRLYPIGAQMKTYTYDPLIGTTSATDVNNATTYYEYDPFGRLQAVKDLNGDVVKQYSYHYSQE